MRKQVEVVAVGVVMVFGVVGCTVPTLEQVPTPTAGVPPQLPRTPTPTVATPTLGEASGPPQVSTFELVCVPPNDAVMEWLRRTGESDLADSEVVMVDVGAGLTSGSDWWVVAAPSYDFHSSGGENWTPVRTNMYAVTWLTTAGANPPGNDWISLYNGNTVVTTAFTRPTLTGAMLPGRETALPEPRQSKPKRSPVCHDLSSPDTGDPRCRQTQMSLRHSTRTSGPGGSAIHRSMPDG